MDTPDTSLWDQAIALLRPQIQPNVFAMCFDSTVQRFFDQSTLIVDVPNLMSRNWMSTHKPLIDEAVEEIVGWRVDVLFEVVDDGKARTVGHGDMMVMDDFAEATKAARAETFRHSRLNPDYTFDSFIVGNNRSAVAFAKAVAENLTKAYNPLFIYGDVGLGKTHLMHAVGNAFAKSHGRSSILYVSSEQFTNAYTESSRKQEMELFRNHYRNVDLLLIDDVQFFMGKKKTQEELFFTFDALHSAGKNIVITSDRPPKDLSDVMERLRTRFEWGLMTDIQAPDLETRMTIVAVKAEALGIPLTREQILLISERIQTNVRSLEGAIARISAHYHIEKRLSQETLSKLIAPFVTREQAVRLTKENICEGVCSYFSVSMADLRGSSRKQNNVNARFLAMYLCRTLGHYSYPEIGAFLSRDHTSVIHGCQKIEKGLPKNSTMQSIVNHLTSELLTSD